MIFYLASVAIISLLVAFHQYFVVSLIFILVAFMFFDSEYGMTRNIGHKVQKQLFLSLWFAEVVLIGMMIPIITIYFLSTLNQVFIAVVLYILGSIAAKKLFNLTLKSVYGMSSQELFEYRCLAAADASE